MTKLEDAPAFSYLEKIPDDSLMNAGLTTSLSLKGEFSVGLEGSYSFGLWGGNLTKEDRAYLGEVESAEDDKKTGFVLGMEQPSWLSVAGAIGATVAYKPTLGIEYDNMTSNTHWTDESKLSSTVYAKVSGTLAKLDWEPKYIGSSDTFRIAKVHIDAGAEKKFEHTFEEIKHSWLFPLYPKLKIKPVSSRGNIKLAVVRTEPMIPFVKDNDKWGLWLEKIGTDKYWQYDLSGHSRTGAHFYFEVPGLLEVIETDSEKERKSFLKKFLNGGEDPTAFEYELPMPLKSMEPGRYALYPYSLKGNASYYYLKPVIKFNVSEDGQLTDLSIEDVPGEML